MRLVNASRVRILLALLLSGVVVGARGQDTSGQSLGDLARKTRKERSSSTHVPAKHMANGEDDGPDGSGVWRARPCPTTPQSYELFIVLPQNPKWGGGTPEARAGLVPILGP